MLWKLEIYDNLVLYISEQRKYVTSLINISLIVVRVQVNVTMTMVQDTDFQMYHSCYNRVTRYLKKP